MSIMPNNMLKHLQAWRCLTPCATSAPTSALCAWAWRRPWVHSCSRPGTRCVY